MVTGKVNVEATLKEKVAAMVVRAATQEGPGEVATMVVRETAQVELEELAALVVREATRV